MAQKKGFYWERHAAAEQFLLDNLGDFRRQSDTLARFEERLVKQTSGRLLDWVDHLLLPDSQPVRDRMTKLGFIPRQSSDQPVWHHPGTQLPRILLTGQGPGPKTGLALRTESVADFLQANSFRAEIEGEPFGPYRRAMVGEVHGVALLAVERRGSADLQPERQPAGYLPGYLSAVELWQTRPRTGDDEDQLWEDIFQRVEQLVAQLGAGPAAHVVCEGERRYWLSRNFAGRLQQGRQATLGLGWGNHDHHTFRSSRRHFRRLVELFTRLGFESRERFYAGEEAGWGAQVMENPAAGLALFLDVDLAPEEVAADFSREELAERQELGTVGLWCALHGDSIFGAGLHHLAALFDFERLIDDLARYGVEYMAPFSDFPYLRQAFSVAERWSVDPARVARLAGDRVISGEQAEKFLAGGAVGSHLENIQRREGYKGFNKKNVSAIIRQTDPRRE
jgi:hypothetical protein